MLKKVGAFLFGLTYFASASVGALTLVGSNYPTFIDQNNSKPSRYTAIVQEAFSRMQTPLQIDIMRQAFVGSALTAGRADGEVMFFSLNERGPTKLYSAPYMPINLHVAGRGTDVADITSFFDIENTRVATENKFANTQALRLQRTVKWSRNPSAFDVFRQIGDERAEYLLADRLLIKEFNFLLKQSNRNPLHISSEALVSANVHISINASTDNAKAVIEQFNEVIGEMQNDGTYNTLLDVAWLSKDVNGDGVADFISAAATANNDVSTAIALDATIAGDTSIYYIDGEAFNSLQAAKEKVRFSSEKSRDSYLEKARYKRMMQDW